MNRVLQAASVLALVAIGSCDVSAAAATPRPICGDRTEILKRLAQRHDETPQALGLSSDGAVLEILVSPDGSWTILYTYPRSPTCVLAVGQSWQMLSLVGQPA